MKEPVEYFHGASVLRNEDGRRYVRVNGEDRFLPPRPLPQNLAASAMKWTGESYPSVQDARHARRANPDGPYLIHRRGELAHPKYDVLMKRMQNKANETDKALRSLFRDHAMKLPKTPGGWKGTLYRGGAMGDKALKDIMKKGKYSRTVYTSFSLGSVTANEFSQRAHDMGKGDEVAFELDVKDIAPGTPALWFNHGGIADGVIGESECLLPPGSFRVLKYKKLFEQLSSQKHVFKVSFRPDRRFTTYVPPTPRRNTRH
jgi:hypothetical protein